MTSRSSDVTRSRAAAAPSANRSAGPRTDNLIRIGWHRHAASHGHIQRCRAQEVGHELPRSVGPRVKKRARAGADKLDDRDPQRLAGELQVDFVLARCRSSTAFESNRPWCFAPMPISMGSSRLVHRLTTKIAAAHLARERQSSSGCRQTNAARASIGGWGSAFRYARTPSVRLRQ